MAVSLRKQTPDEWLLERFDTGRVRKHQFAPTVVAIKDDHPPGECEALPGGTRCLHWSGEATWPRAETGWVSWSANPLMQLLMTEENCEQLEAG